MPLLPSTIERDSDRNPAGGCRLQFARVEDVASFPDEVNGVLAAPITLVSGAQWITVHAPQFTQDFVEEWLLVGGDQLAQASLGFVISKDRPQLLAGLYRLKPGRYVALHHDHNGTVKCIGTKEEPAQLRIEKLAHGRQPGADRNAYEGLVSLRRRTACPFYGATPPSPVPNSCPTVQQQLAELSAAQIAAILDALDLTEAVQAEICMTLCAMLDEAIVLGDGANATAVVNCLSPEQASVLLDALGGSGGPCPTLCELIDAAFASGSSDPQLTLDGDTDALPESGTANGKPTYTNASWGPGNLNAEAYWFGGEWVLNIGSDTWTSDEDVASVDLVTTWDGPSPAPSITAGGGGAQTIADCLSPEQAEELIAALGGAAGGTVRIRNSADSATLDEVEAPGDYVMPPVRIPYVDADGAPQYFLVYISSSITGELTVTEPGGGPPPVPRFRVRTTAGGTIVGYRDITSPTLDLPQSVIKYKDAANASQVTAASDTEYASGTLRPATEVPRRELKNLNGTGMGVHVTVDRLIADTVPNARIPLKLVWDAGDADTTIWTVTDDEAGTYGTYTQTGTNGTVTYSKNGGGYAALSGSISLAIGDTITVRRTTTTNAGSTRWVP